MRAVILFIAILFASDWKDPMPLNESILSAIEHIQLENKLPYDWPREVDTWGGVTKDLFHDGEPVARGGAGTYCCGVTFEAWFRAASEENTLAGVSVAEVRELRENFCGDGAHADRERLVAGALSRTGFGTPVIRLEDARPGDLVQFWRHDGGGHSVVFLGWGGRKRKVTEIHYWSSQRRTGGVGRATEAVGLTGVDRQRIYIVRPAIRRLPQR